VRNCTDDDDNDDVQVATDQRRCDDDDDNLISSVDVDAKLANYRAAARRHGKHAPTAGKTSKLRLESTSPADGARSGIRHQLAAAALLPQPMPNEDAGMRRCDCGRRSAAAGRGSRTAW